MSSQPRITKVFGAVNIGSFRISAMIAGMPRAAATLLELPPTVREARLCRTTCPLPYAAASARARSSTGDSSKRQNGSSDSKMSPACRSTR